MISFRNYFFATIPLVSPSSGMTKSQIIRMNTNLKSGRYYHDYAIVLLKLTA